MPLGAWPGEGHVGFRQGTCSWEVSSEHRGLSTASVPIQRGGGTAGRMKLLLLVAEPRGALFDQRCLTQHWILSYFYT